MLGFCLTTPFLGTVTCITPSTAAYEKSYWTPCCNLAQLQKGHFRYYSQKLEWNVNFIYCKNHSHNKIPASSTSPPQIILKTSAAILNVSKILPNTGEGEKYCWLQSHLLRQRANAQNISFVTLNSGQIVLSTQLIIILNYPVFGMCSF